MSRVRNIINEMTDASEEPIVTPLVPVEQSNYIAHPAGDPQHTHEVQTDAYGNGSLGAVSNDEDHTHNMINWEVQPSGTFPHIHIVAKEEILSPTEPVGLPDSEIGEADKELDDEVSDTKEKVKVVIPKAAPNVRRVFDKTGKYMGSFDTKNKKDSTKYKTMFKGAK